MDLVSPPLVRQALTQDAAALSALMRALQHQTPYVLPTWEELKTDEAQQRELATLNSENWGRIFVGMGSAASSSDEQELVGFLAISRRRAHKIRHVASCALAILQAQHRRGFGRAMLAEAEAWARQAGVRRLELSVVTDNAPAIALYLGCGFVREGVKRQSFRVDAGLVDEILMAKVW